MAPTKEQGFLDFPITNISSLLPIAFTVANPVRRILVCFPPTQASNRRFSGWIEKKKKQKKQIHLRGKFHQVCTWTKWWGELFPSMVWSFYKFFFSRNGFKRNALIFPTIMSSSRFCILLSINCMCTLSEIGWKYVMLCAVWYHLCNLENVKSTHGGVLLLVKLQALASNFTKSNTPAWVFFTFFKLYKW